MGGIINVFSFLIVDTSHGKRWSGGGLVLMYEKQLIWKGIRWTWKIGQKNRKCSVVSISPYLHKLFSTAWILNRKVWRRLWRERIFTSSCGNSIKEKISADSTEQICNLSFLYVNLIFFSKKAIKIEFFQWISLIKVLFSFSCIWQQYENCMKMQKNNLFASMIGDQNFH